MLKKLEDLAEKAGIMMTDTENLGIREKTSSRDLVTTNDLAVQEMLMEECSKLAPGCSFYCEENDMQDRDILHGECFIIDPIDGTANYVYGLDHSCTSIAYLEDGIVKCGVVYDPFRREMFSASEGKGCFLNGKKAGAITDRTLGDAMTCFGTAPYDEDTNDLTFRLAQLLYENSRDVRRTGSAALDCCYAAVGRFDLYFELRISPWDHAAGSFIVREAGRHASDMKGEPLDLTKRTSILCGSNAAAERFLELSEPFL